MCACARSGCIGCVAGGGAGQGHALSPQQAKRTLVSRFQPTVDRFRQFAVGLGLNPYQVFLCWTWWDGGERGIGKQKITKRVPILPTPNVQDMTSVSFSAANAGILPVGSVRVERISGAYSAEILSGLAVPCDPAVNDHAARLLAMRDGTFGGPPPAALALATESVPQPFEFFYEIVEDGRGGGEPRRERFRAFTRPFRRADKNDWSIVLERQSEEMERGGDVPAYPTALEDD